MEILRECSIHRYGTFLINTRFAPSKNTKCCSWWVLVINSDIMTYLSQRFSLKAVSKYSVTTHEDTVRLDHAAVCPPTPPNAKLNTATVPHSVQCFSDVSSSFIILPATWGIFVQFHRFRYFEHIHFSRLAFVSQFNFFLNVEWHRGK